jgi:CheY-like chemotaxis protein
MNIKKLGEILMETGSLAESQLKHALSLQKTHKMLLGEILVEEGYVQEEDIINALITQYNFTYIPIDNFDISQEVLKIIPKQIALKYYLLPVFVMGDVLTITMANPLDKTAIKEVQETTKYKKIEVYIDTVSNIKKVLNKHYPEEAIPKEKERETDKKESVSLKEKRILIIGDNPKTALAIKIGLEEANYKTFTAENRSTALDIINKREPSLVILDIELPLMDNYAFIQKLRAQKSMRYIPIIAVTPKADAKNLFENDETTDYIIKPYSSEDLMARIRLALGTTKADEKNAENIEWIE